MSKILVVDDNKANQEIIKEILLSSDGKYNVQIVDTGEKAIESVEKNEVDLVLLDDILPGINGLDTCKRIHDITGKKFLPAILMTKLPKESMKMEELGMGAIDYLTKPIHSGELIAKVAGLLKIKEIVDDSRWAVEKANKGTRKLYKDLEQKNEELKKLDVLKDEFISTVSHELRTPLTTMKEFTAILSDEIPGKLTSDQKEYIDIVKGNIDRLSRLVEDLLDISKIEARKLKLKKASVDIIHLAQSVVSTLKPAADKAKITLETSFAASSLDVNLDSDRIIQAITNLLSNAIKFTPANGKVTVKIKDHKTQIECSVIDTGIGIAPENLNKLFGKFQQFDRRVGPGHKGTGLGLAITKKIIEMHNGTIGVESEFKKGSKFIITLPKNIKE